MQRIPVWAAWAEQVLPELRAAQVLLDLWRVLPVTVVRVVLAALAVLGRFLLHLLRARLR